MINLHFTCKSITHHYLRNRKKIQIDQHSIQFYHFDKHFATFMNSREKTKINAGREHKNNIVTTPAKKTTTKNKSQHENIKNIQ